MRRLLLILLLIPLLSVGQQIGLSLQMSSIAVSDATVTPCIFSVAPSADTIQGGIDTAIFVFTASGSWCATTTANWLTLSTSNDTIYGIATANTGDPRTATITINCSGTVFTVYQPAGYSNEANALFARMTTQPDATRKGLINDLIVGLKDDTLWSICDVLQVYAAGSSQASLLNWIADTNNAKDIGGCTFTADKGWAGDGSAKYINTMFNPSVDGVNFTQNSASFGLCIQTSDASGGVASNGINSGSQVMFFPLFSGNVYASCNYTNFDGVTIANTDVKGYTFVMRTTSTNQIVVKNKTAASSTDKASSAPANTNMYVGGSSNGGVFNQPNAYQYSFFWVGAGMTVYRQNKLIDRMETYLDAIGAGVAP